MTRLIVVLLVLLLAAPAARAVDVRQSRGEDRTRTVFSWEGKVAYEAARGPAGLEVAFSRAADLVPGQGFSVSATDPLRVLFPLGQGQEARHFRLGDRVFVDVYGDPPPAPKSEAAGPKKAGPSPSPEPEPGPVLAPEPAPAAEFVLAPVPVAQPILPHILGLAATQTLNLAVFAQARALYVLAEPAEARIEPRVTPPRGQASALATLEVLDPPPPGARAWRLSLPHPTPRIRARGGEMSWEVVVGAGAHPTAETKRLALKAVPGPGGGLALLWPVPGGQAGVPTRLPDARTGGPDLLILPVTSAAWRTPEAWEYPEFSILPAPAGLVVRPKVDDLALARTDEGALITRPGGLTLAPPRQAAPEVPPPQAQEQKGPVLYDLAAWRGGEPEDLASARVLILARLHDAPQAARVQGILTLARMHLAHGRGAEALGFLRYAAALVPALENTPDFLAWRGAASALAGRGPEAFADLSTPSLNAFPEVNYWCAFALAGLEDWHQAAATLPAPPGPLSRYPEPVRTRLALTLAEVALRAGQADKGAAFLALAQVPEDGPLARPFGAAKAYLTGEAARQRGDAKAAQSAWAPVLTGEDALYRTKATLAATRLLLADGALSPGQAIDQIERVRYLWRGDGLEAQVIAALGGVYFDESQHTKGLALMRRAAEISAHTDLGRDVVAEMETRFTGLFMDEKRLAALPAPEAAALYDAFGELVPAGAEGDALTARLAGHLIGAGLFDRGADLLAGQVERGAKAETSLRLAAVRLMADEPDAALAALDKVACTGSCAREAALLRARALAQQDKGKEALAVLEALPDGGQGQEAARARADIAWQDQDWGAAEAALADLLRALSVQPVPGPESPAPAPEVVEIVLRRAVALRLADEKVALAQWRASWGPAMAGTDKGPAFGVVTDPGGAPSTPPGTGPGPSPAEDARLWQESLAGADLFATFLERYKKGQPSLPP